MHIELRAVSKRFGDNRVLDRVSLEIEPGQIVVVLGANGAGKTTLLRLLAGILSPNTGKIWYDDQPFGRNDLELRRRLFFLPDFPSLIGEVSALRNLALILRLYGADGPGVEERVLAHLEEFDLLHLAEAPVDSLSRGQFYKVALTALFVVDPELWLLDEPLASGMDPLGIAVFRRRAREAARRGRTILYSTQMLDSAERLGDRVCVIDGGEIRAFETLEKLREQAGQAPVLESLFERLRDSAS